MSAAALSTTVLSVAALINHEIKSLNERRGLKGYCAERRGLNIYIIFPIRSAAAFKVTVMGAAVFACIY